MNQLHKPKSFSPCHAVGWSCRPAGADTDCSIAHSLSCPPHRQHHGGSQRVPGTQLVSGLRAETPQSSCCWALWPGQTSAPHVRSQCSEAEGLAQHSAEPKCASQWVLGFTLRGLAGLPQPWLCNSSCAWMGAHPAHACLQLKVSSLEYGSINTFTSQGKQQPS